MPPTPAGTARTHHGVTRPFPATAHAPPNPNTHHFALEPIRGPAETQTPARPRIVVLSDYPNEATNKLVAVAWSRFSRGGRGAAELPSPASAPPRLRVSDCILTAAPPQPLPKRHSFCTAGQSERSRQQVGRSGLDQIFSRRARRRGASNAALRASAAPRERSHRIRLHGRAANSLKKIPDRSKRLGEKVHSDRPAPPAADDRWKEATHRCAPPFRGS